MLSLANTGQLLNCINHVQIHVYDIIYPINMGSKGIMQLYVGYSKPQLIFRLLNKLFVIISSSLEDMK